MPVRISPVEKMQIFIFAMVFIALIVIIIFAYSATQGSFINITEFTYDTCYPCACTIDADCKNWEKCDDAQCVPRLGRCGVNNDCEVWQTCNKELNTCENKPGRCTTDQGCPSDQQCIETHCITRII